MNVTAIALAAGIALAAPALAAAVEEIRVGLPDTIELVELEPGLQVVAGIDLEVFNLDGVYWLRRGDRWYSSRRPQAAFEAAELRQVPPGLARLPPGRYHEFRPEAGQARVTRHLGSAEPSEHGGVRVDTDAVKVEPRGGPAKRGTAPAASPSRKPARGAKKPAAARGAPKGSIERPPAATAGPAGASPRAGEK